jgi:hypothetical protein
MEREVKLFGILAWTVPIAALTFFLVEGGLFLRSGRLLANDLEADRATIAPEILRVLASTETAAASIQAIELNTTRTEAEMAGLLNAERHSVVDQKRVFDSAASTFDSVNVTVRSINDTLIPRMVAVLDSADTAVAGVGDSARVVGLDADSLVEKVGPLLEAATSDLTDPAIHGTLANVKGITADMHEETGIILKQTKQAFAPKNKIISLLKAIVGGTVTGAELFYYLSH